MAPVIEIVNCGNHGRRTKDIFGGPKIGGLKKGRKGQNFTVFAFKRPKRKSKTTSLYKYTPS